MNTLAIVHHVTPEMDIFDHNPVPPFLSDLLRWSVTALSWPGPTEPLRSHASSCHLACRPASQYLCTSTFSNDHAVAATPQRYSAIETQQSRTMIRETSLKVSRYLRTTSWPGADESKRRQRHMTAQSDHLTYLSLRGYAISASGRMVR